MGNRPDSVLEMIDRFENDPGDALICGRERISYRQLCADYRAFAGELSGAGLKKGDAAIIRKTRGTGYVVSVLGVLRAGGICVQADPDWPEERLKGIADDCGARLEVTDDGILRHKSRADAEETASGSDAGDAPAPVMPGDPSMIYYTSGSTGSPKGSVITHRMLCDPVIPCEENVTVKGAVSCRTACVMLGFSYAFTVLHLFTALCSGKRVVIATEEERADPARLGTLMKRWEVDMMSVTPSLLRIFLADPVFAEAARGLKQLCLAGEPLPENLEREICARVQGTAFDTYGSSEMLHLGARTLRGDGVPSQMIPALGAAFYVFKEPAAFQEAALDEEGELLIGGIRAQQSRYLNRPDLNAEKYLQHPEYGRLFLTGDRAVLTGTGALLIRGRKDSMLKLRGQRLEPQEIEDLMVRFPGITQGAVTLEGEGEQARLIAFYTAEEEIDPGELREWFSERLPHYMIPVRFARVASLPVNENGKLDRKALPELSQNGEENAYEEAVNEVQRLICSLFQRILKTGRPVGITDDFFALGGDSIRGMQIVSMLRQEGYTLRLRDLFTWPTAVALSEVIGREADADEKPESSPFGGILGCLNAEERRAVKEVVPLEKVEAVYPFLPAMKHRLYDAKDRVWFNASLAYLKQPADEERLKQRFRELLLKRQMLRAFVICPGHAQPMTVVLKDADTELFTMDIRWMKQDERRQKQHIRSFVRAFRAEGFGPGRPAFLAGLIRLDEAGEMLLILSSHYLLDGMSIQRITEELTGSGALASDSGDVSLYYRRWEAAAGAAGTAAYWKKLLGGRSSYTPLAPPPGSSGENHIRIRRFLLPLERVRDYCGKRQVTPAAWIHAAVGAALAELTGLPQVVFASMCSGRDESLTEDASLTGNYAAELPFVYEKGASPEDCQRQLLAGSAYCMYEFPGPESGEGAGWRQPGYVRCDILNFPLAEGTVSDDFTLAEDHYTEAQGDYMKELEMFYVLGDKIYATWIYDEAFVSDEAARGLEALLKAYAKRFPDERPEACFRT